MSVVATAGAAAWVVPEIVTAKPAAGATLSGTPGTTSGSTDGPTAPSTLASTSPRTSTGSLAFTGVDIERDAELGAALIAGGWAMHHWASRRAKPVNGVHGAGSPVDPT